MGRVYTTSEDLTSVANAIREKSGSNSSLVYPSGFISEIGNISTGETVVEEKDVNFYDYDGTIVASYTAAQFANLSALPSNPTHEGLTAQGWNWDLADAKTFVATYGKLDIGQMYVTTSGATEIDITLNDSNYLSPYLMFGVNGTIEIDWGDNSLTDTRTGTSTFTIQYQQHIYANTGNYTIKLKAINGTISLVNVSSTYAGILRYGNKNAQLIGASIIYSQTINFIRIGSNITLESYPFTGCLNLKYITLPSTFTSMKRYAFYKCYNLKCVIVPKEVTIIDSYCFQNCYSLSKLVLPFNLIEIGTYSFSYCTDLHSLILPSKLTTIPSYCFISTNLYTLIIPTSITSIEHSAFNMCKMLKINLILPSNMTTVPNSICYSCQNLLSITLPSNATEIGTYSFYNCQKLIYIEIPSQVTTIKNYAFFGCENLFTITIPANVTDIGNSAFSSNYVTEEYHFLPTSPPTLGAYVFSNISSNTIIYVPYSSDHSILNAYKTATNWSTWADYIQEEPAP